MAIQPAPAIGPPSTSASGTFRAGRNRRFSPSYPFRRPAHRSRIAHRVLGLETEFAYAFQPAEPGGPRPTRREIYRVLRAALKKEVLVLGAAYKKEADFLENGSLVHHEVQIRQFDEGLLEWATPECLTPLELVLYSKSQELLLAQIRAAAEKALAANGFPGRLRLLKNNVDRRGENYGCHENYECLDERSLARRAVRDLVFLAFWTLFLPFFLLPRVLFLIALGVFLVLLLLYFLLHVARRIPLLGLAVRGLADPLDQFLARRGSRLDEDFVRYLSYFIEWLYFPFVKLYSALTRPFLFESYTRGLTAHLACRIVFAGTGRVDLSAPAGFHLSQRADFLDSVQRIFWNERTKPLFDVKNVLIEPATFLATRKRLHILAGDSNLSDVAEFLKVGTTALVVDRIEARGPAGLPVLADPLGALRAISRDPSLTAKVRLAGGEEKTGVEIERLYLLAVREHLRESGVVPLWAGEVMRRWEETLDRLEADLDAAAPEVEWLLKKRILDSLLWGRSSWDRMVRWGPHLARVLAAAERAPGCWIGGAEIVRVLPVLLGEAGMGELLGALERDGLIPEDLPRHLELYLEMKKVDFQFHELDPEEGAWMRLADEGHVTRLLGPDAVRRACHEPPEGTRARPRGLFVKVANERRLAATAGWKELRVQHPRRVISLKDPLGNSTELVEKL
ncbi:MAG: proteasome accessory factor PafA2 family protein [Planctomycetes bacterium]|nr:proteasome accessory factor PafA2 family protein [Planctomycetota bacterium]